MCIHNECRMETKNVPSVIVACCVVHNIAMKRGLIDVEEYKNFDPHDFGMAEDDQFVGREDGAMRDHIVNQIFI